MSEKILQFVKRNRETGCRWTDLETEFVGKRGWSKGAFVNHFKKAKINLRKEFDDEGRPRYFVKDQHKKELDIGFFEWLNRRAERKSREEERQELELDVDFLALSEEILLHEDEYADEMTPEKWVRRRQKYRRLLRNDNPNASHRS